MDDRRTTLRREADRELLAKLRSVNDQQAADHLKRKRRRAIRHNCVAQIRVEMVSKAGAAGDWKERAETIKARVLDLSESGASVFTPVPLSAGQQTQVKIGLAGGKVIESGADVRWSKEKASKGGYAVGLNFTRLGPEQEALVRAFLDELDQTLGL